MFLSIESLVPLSIFLFSFSLINGIELSHLGCFKKGSLLSNSTEDLWFNLTANGPSNCVNLCFKNSFRYAGVGGEEVCLCGSTFGREGSASSCNNCTKTPQLICGSSTSLSVYNTHFNVPSAARELVALTKTENAIEIGWEKPIASNGFLKGYKITAQSIFSYSTDEVGSESWELMDGDLRSHYLIGLTQGTKYNVSVRALGEEGSSSPISLVVWTRIGVPLTPDPPEIIWEKQGQMRIRLPTTLENTRGPISAYRIALIDQLQLPFFNKETNMSWEEAVKEGHFYYITGEWKGQGSLPSQFTIGTGEMVGGFLNGKIPPNGHWHPILGLISTQEGVTTIAYSPTGHHPNIPLHQRGGGESGYEEIIIEDDGGLVTALWIAVAVASCVLLFCIAIFLLLRFKLLPTKRPIQRENHQLRDQSQTAPYALSTTSNHYLVDEECLGGYTHTGFVSEEEDWQSRCLDKLLGVRCLPRSEVQLPSEVPQTLQGDHNNQLIAEGKWGKIYKSTWKGENIHLHKLPSLKKEGDEELFRNLDSVICLSPHVNVAQLLGFLQEDCESIYLAVEHPGIPLKTLLLSLRGTETNISSQNLLLCAMGVAEGLFHLHSYKVTHGQVAACNVLIPSENGWQSPKLTSFGILTSNRERDGSRWMAVEQLHNRCISPSDTWAFGILLWEIATLGGTPYGDIRGEDLKRRVERGARPTQLENMSDALYQIMLNCWQLDREERPDPGSLACQIHDLLNTAQNDLFVSGSIKWPPYIPQFETLH